MAFTVENTSGAAPSAPMGNVTNMASTSTTSTMTRGSVTKRYIHPLSYSPSPLLPSTSSYEVTEVSQHTITDPTPDIAEYEVRPVTVCCDSSVVIHSLSLIPTPTNSPPNSLQTELMQLMMSSPPGISAFPDGDGSNMLNWTATMIGPEGTPYEGLKFKLSFTFPGTYPYTPPTVLFKTPVYHPNVDFAGRICLDILKDKWSAVYNVQSVMLSLQSLLGEPNKYVFHISHLSCSFRSLLSLSVAAHAPT